MKSPFDIRMEDLVKRYDQYKDLHKPVEYIRNGLGSCFTCLLYPGMEPTNNLAEQAIREHVVIRKERNMKERKGSDMAGVSHN